MRSRSRNVVDQADEAVGVSDGNAEQVATLWVERTEHTGGQQAERATDAGERRSELVRDSRDELVFQRVEGGTFFKEALFLVPLVTETGELLLRVEERSAATKVRDPQVGGDGEERQGEEYSRGHRTIRAGLVLGNSTAGCVNFTYLIAIFTQSLV